jgi:hypothetical protein
MRLEAAISGNLPAFMKRQTAEAEAAVTAGVRTVSNAVRDDLKAQVVTAGLGPNLAKTWKVLFYPKGKKSISAAGLVYADSPKVIRAFNDGTLIRSSRGLYLAIPTDAAPKRGIGGKRISPSTFPEYSLGKLRFVYRPGRISLLVVDGLRAGTGKRTGFRKASASALRTGRGVATVVMFFLVPQAKMPKKLDVLKVADQHRHELGQAILDNWQDEDSHD